MQGSSKGVAAATRQRQSEVTRSGADWEEFVATSVTRSQRGLLARNGIEIVNARSLNTLRTRHERLYRILGIPVVNQRYETAVWGDIDLIAAKDDMPIAIISCKTSLHGRLTETLFYSLLYRTVKNLRVVISDPDGDVKVVHNGNPSGANRDERQPRTGYSPRPFSPESTS